MYVYTDLFYYYYIYIYIYIYIYTCNKFKYIFGTNTEIFITSIRTKQVHIALFSVIVKVIGK